MTWAAVAVVTLAAASPACNWERTDTTADASARARPDVAVGDGATTTTTAPASPADRGVRPAGGDAASEAPDHDLDAVVQTVVRLPSWKRPQPPVADDGAVGALGPALLRPEVTEAVIEIAGAPGLDLTDATVATLEAELRDRGGKRSVVTTYHAPLPVQDVYTLDQLRTLAADHRGETSRGRRVVVHVLVLPGRFEDNRHGVVFASSSLAVFPEAIRRNHTGPAALDIESQVVRHELGHLYGLVNLLGKREGGEDPTHRGHSPNIGSVMHWAIGSGTGVEGTPASRVFDDDDVAELDRIRTLPLPSGFG